VALLATGLSGLMLGSFLNVVAFRLPRGESLVRPASHCPSCGAAVRPYDNVPVLSWLWLRGRCRGCGERISPRYPVVEAVTALLLVAVLAVKGADVDALPGLALVLVLVPTALIDLEYRIIPNALMAIGAAVGLALLAVADASHLADHLFAAMAAGGFFFVVVLAYPAGMGMGDVKLAAVLGLYLGASVIPALAVALLAGTMVGVVIIARKGARAGRKTAVPFGPFLALGGIVGLLAGPAMIDWYLKTFAGG
jgi:leader peptidase (prepilin peptidase) / N-methyltransferase